MEGTTGEWDTSVVYLDEDHLFEFTLDRRYWGVLK